MPEDLLVPSGDYKLRKRFRNEEQRRQKKDLPWSKQILDLEENRFFGRTPWAWVLIVCFYLLLYLLILLIVLFWLLIFNLYILSDNAPRWLKGSPGLAVVPCNSSTITYYPSILQEVDEIVDKIDKFISKLDEGAADIFSECNEDKLWGYHLKTPCVFVKINKVIGWTAKTYDSVDELPKEASQAVKETMTNYPGENRIWLTCDFKEYDPKIKFIPGPYFDASNNLTGTSRVIALQLLEMPENSPVFFICKAWAENIEIDDKHQGKGHVRFSLNIRVDTAERPKPESLGNSTEPPKPSTAANLLLGTDNGKIEQGPDTEPPDDIDNDNPSDSNTERPDIA